MEGPGRFVHHHLKLAKFTTSKWKFTHLEDGFGNCDLAAIKARSYVNISKME